MTNIISLVTGISNTVDKVIIKRILEYGDRLHATQENKNEYKKLADSYTTFAEGIHHYQSAIQSALSSDEFLSTLDKQELKRLLTSLNNTITDAESKLPMLDSRIGQVISTPGSASKTQTQDAQHSEQSKKDRKWWWRRKIIVPQATIHAYRDQDTIKQLNQCLEKAEAKLKEGSELVQTKFGIFKVHFKQYFRGNDIYLDYTNGDQENSSHEAKLKHALLHPSNIGSSIQHGSIPRTTCVQGQGGMGKTTILKDICNQEDVRREFHDGIHFMTIGEGGGDEQVIKEMSRCLKNAGFGTVAEKMKDEESVEDAAVKISKIMQEKRVMIVADDWHPDHVRYLKHFKSLLSKTQRGVLLVSSRYSQVSVECDKVFFFKELEPTGEGSRKILLKRLGYENLDEHSDGETREAIESILKVCGGIKLCLAIAGSSIRLRNSGRGGGGCDEEMIKRYVEDLERTCDQLVTKASGEDMRSFLSILVASLGYCSSEIKLSRHKDVKGGSLRNVEAKYLFKSLCIFEKQQQIPIETVSRLWDIAKRDTLQIVLTLRNYNILSVDESEQWIEVHDKVLDVARYLAEEDGEGRMRRWHERILQGYIPLLQRGICKQGDKGGIGGESRRDDESANEGDDMSWDVFSFPRKWKLDAGEDYFIENVCRHLAEGGRIEELWNLVTNVWWTIRRKENGGLVGLISDLKRVKNVCEGVKGREKTGKTGKLFDRRERVGMDILMDHIRDGWMGILDDKHMIGFEMFGRVSMEERRYWFVERYLKSIEEEGPRPWLKPMTTGLRYVDGRQINNISEGREQEIDARKRHAGLVYDVRMSREGNRVVSGGGDGTTRVWDVERGVQVGKAIPEHIEGAVCVGMSKDGSRIVSSGKDGSVRVWDVERGEQVGKALTGYDGWVWHVEMSRDGNRVVSGGEDGSVRLWDAERGQQIGKALTGHDGSVWSARLNRYGNRVVSGGKDGSVRVWDVGRGEQVGKALKGHNGWVWDVAISKDGNRVVSGGRDGSVRVWDVEREEQIYQAPNEHEWVLCVGMSEDGNRVVSGGVDGIVRVWDVEKGEQVGPALTGHDDWVRCIGMSKDGNRVVSGGVDGSVRVWDVKMGEQVGKAIIGPGRGGWAEWSQCIGMSKDGNRVVSGGRDGSLRIWDVESGEQVGKALTGHEGEVRCVGMSKDGNRVVSSGRDGSLRIWDVESGEQVGKALTGHQGEVRCVGMSKDGNRVVCGGKDGSLRIWDVESREQVGKALTGHEGEVQCVRMSKDGNRVVSSGKDGSLRVWDVKREEQIGDSFELEKIQNIVNDLVSVSENDMSKTYISWLKLLQLSATEQDAGNEQVICVKSLHEDVYPFLQELGISWFGGFSKCDCSACELEDEDTWLVGNESSIMTIQKRHGIYVNDPKLLKVGNLGSSWCVKDCRTVAIGSRYGRVMVCHLQL